MISGTREEWVRVELNSWVIISMEMFRFTPGIITCFNRIGRLITLEVLLGVRFTFPFVIQLHC
jgi:hypothetical protein